MLQRSCLLFEKFFSFESTFLLNVSSDSDCDVFVVVGQMNVHSTVKPCQSSVSIWEQLPLWLTSLLNVYIYIWARTKGISSFLIVGRSDVSYTVYCDKIIISVFSYFAKKKVETNFSLRKRKEIKKKKKKIIREGIRCRGKSWR